MNDIPPSPGSEPLDRRPSDPPSIFSGAFWKTVKDKYDRHKNKKSILDGSAWKTVIGVSFTGVSSNATKITLGYEHKSVQGGSISTVIPWENKLNVGVVTNFIIVEKAEETMVHKWEFTLGAKRSRVNGNKTKFEGSNKVKVSDIENANKTNKMNQHILAAERLITKLLDQEIKNLENEHAKVQEIVKKADEEYKKLEEEIKNLVSKGYFFKSDIRKAQYEIDTVNEKVSGKFKAVADAAAEITSKAKIEANMGSEGKFVARSLLSIGAAITQAG